MSVLAEVYASNPQDEYIIHALEIKINGEEPIRVCNGYEDLMLSGHEYEAGSISVSLPKRTNTGQQTLVFGLWNVYGVAQDYVTRALESNSIVFVTYHQYLGSDTDNPISSTPLMPIIGGTFSGVQARFEASFQDLLNTAFPRQRYTSETAPGIQYMT